MTQISKFQLGHASVDRLNRKTAVEAVMDRVRIGTPAFVVTPNSDHLVRLESDAELREIYQNAAITIADGMPLVWASKLLGEALEERVTGADLMPDLCEAAAKSGAKVFLLGAKEGVAEEAKRRLEGRYPGLRIVGTLSPPLGFEADPSASLAIEQALLASAPDLIFVGLGAPKQEKWIYRHYRKFPKGVFLGIGASIDFCAGQVSRAPLWLQKSGLEWVYRLLQEPRRLAKRYAADTFVLWIILREWWRRRA